MLPMGNAKMHNSDADDLRSARFAGLGGPEPCRQPFKP
jgi:hypothetical protein